MAKKRKTRSRPQPRPAQGRPSPNTASSRRQARAVPLTEIRDELATHPGLAPAPVPPAQPATEPGEPPARVSEEELRRAWAQCQELIGQATAWINLQSELTGRETTLAEREQQIDLREAAVSAAEADARDGWKDRLAAAEKETRATARAAADKELAAQRAEVDVELRQRREEAEELLAAERQELREQQARLESDLEALSERTEQLSALRTSFFKEQTDSEMSRVDLLQKAERAQARAEELEAVNKILSDQLTTLIGVRDRAMRQKLLLRGRSLEDALQRLAELEARELVGRTDAPDMGATLQREADQLLNRNKELEQLVQERNRTITDLTGENTSLRLQAAQDRVGEEITSSWQEMAEVASMHVQRLRSELDSLRASAARNPFPRLKAIDESTDPVRRPQQDGSLDLKSLASALRECVVTPDQQPLFYSLTDIRSFIAGMSSSHLILLQGASGTGKTSLPRAVAKALRWGSGVVAVQAGWRDQQDLIGYYNTFDSRFQEEDFLAHLYAAGAEQHKHRPYLIVLDEANLSSMEHYFATFLSALELKDPQPINLSPIPHASAPSRTEDGTALAIPSNVWFMATANQDETTRRFAPKTIDRSTVLELQRVGPWQSRPSGAKWIEAQDVTLKRLRAAFTKARRDYSAEVEALTRSSNDIQTALDDADLAVGERFFTQSKDFIATFLASGGASDQALERLWLRKVLYRLPERGEADRDIIEQLRMALTDMWHRAGLDGGVPKTWSKRLDKAFGE